jgi:serine/threonine-protein kinase
MGHVKADWSRLCSELIPADAVGGLPARVQFPVMPQSVVDFSQLAERPDVSTEHLAAIIERDSALIVALLKYVNSAALGLKWKVDSVGRAVAALGVRRTRTVLLTAALQQALRGVTSRFIHPQRFQRDNSERSLFAGITAETLGADPETSRTASLLQDLLLPSLTAAYDDDYRDYDHRSGDLNGFERERFGWTHAQLLARLMHTWGFPDELTACVALHHETDRVLEDPALAGSAAAATAIAALLPESLQQCPHGLDRLLTLQDRYPRFVCLDIAARVDELSREDSESGSERSELAVRLEKLALARLERCRLEAVLLDRQLGSYALEDKLGEGGMGVVYRARHCLLKRPAAIKLLHTNSLDRVAIARFESEVQLTCRLTSPNTVAVYDYGITPQGIFYYAMEYIEGLTLGALVRRFGPQPEGRVIYILTQACRSLGEAHQLGLIHRDIKPDNIMLTRRGGVADFVKVLDFGLACAMDGRHHGVCGTPEYLAPEAITSPQVITPRRDLYALGAVGYFLLTGSDVFSARETAEVLRHQIRTVPPRVSERCGREIDAALESVVMDCLEKDPDRRPLSAQHVCERLARSERAREWTELTAAAWWQNYAADDMPEQVILGSGVNDVGSIPTRIGAGSDRLLCSDALFPAGSPQ